MRERIAYDRDGNLIDAYEALETGEMCHCIHPGCPAWVHGQWGPGHREAFFYAFAWPGNQHDHSQEGDRTVLTIRKPVSNMIHRILAPRVPPIHPVKMIKRRKSIKLPPVTAVSFAEKHRNINTLVEAYRSGICSTPGFYSTVVNGEMVGNHFTTYVDRQFLFKNVFGPRFGPSLLTGEHIIELIPDRVTTTGIRAFQSCNVDCHGISRRAYINISIPIPDPALRHRIINRCFSRARHMILICGDFRETCHPVLSPSGIWRTAYECTLIRSAQIAVSPEPMVNP